MPNDGDDMLMDLFLYIVVEGKETKRRRQGMRSSF
jgi:hypothetical protein